MSISLEDYRDLICLTPYPRPEIFENEEELKEAGTKLLIYLQRERGLIAAFNVPMSKKQEKIRRLVNERMPLPVPPEVLALQDRILWTLSVERGIVQAEDLEWDKNGFCLWQGDITRLATDAIVNAANGGLLGCFTPAHDCIDNVIHSYAGMQLRDDCASIMAKQGTSETPGNAKITRAYNLPAKYVIHTVGPIVGNELNDEQRGLLRSCYTSCLNLAREMNLKSIAFCCVATGLFNFPHAEAAEIAVGATYSWKLRNPDYDIKVVFDTYLDSDTEIYRNILSHL